MLKTITNEDIHKQLTLGIISLHLFTVLCAVILYNILSPQKEKQKVEYTLELINQTDVSIKPVNNTQADTIPFEDIEEYILRDNL